MLSNWRSPGSVTKEWQLMMETKGASLVPCPGKSEKGRWRFAKICWFCHVLTCFDCDAILSRVLLLVSLHIDKDTVNEYGHFLVVLHKLNMHFAELCWDWWRERREGTGRDRVPKTRVETLWTPFHLWSSLSILPQCLWFGSAAILEIWDLTDD